MKNNKTSTHFFLTLGIQIILLIGLANCLTHIWGHLHPRSMRLYEINFKLERDISDVPYDDDEAFAEIQFPEQGARNKYIITMIMVSSESKHQLADQAMIKDNSDEVDAVVVNGGVGLNHTIIRIQRIPAEANLHLTIFGVHPNSYI